MANRTSRHQKPGQKNLRGKLSKGFCPCCDDVINHKPKVLAKVHMDEMLDGASLEYITWPPRQDMKAWHP